jgi:hypothetical protein
MLKESVKKNEKYDKLLRSLNAWNVREFARNKRGIPSFEKISFSMYVV